ncbi:hypothetical protein IAR55_004807 [Kwoniella newhampshirensis]|uniref:Respiratory supercomplex factor 1, mitochondrial n=1 Tax=Kwoniella newhampshirensis TaxID=1651941 RepID=A0AAW0YWT5_9TREE
MPSSASLAEKERREAHQQRAYEIQLAGGMQGAARWTVYGAIACTLGHYAWPGFRRQTLGLKAFLTTSATIFGLVVGADNHLLQYEHGLREAENEIRRQARASLALEGRIATESEIRGWREGNERRKMEEKSVVEEKLRKEGLTKGEIEAVTGGDGLGPALDVGLVASDGRGLGRRG